MKVIHADSALLVLDKPAGLLSVPGRGEDKQDCLSARVQAIYADALIVHRLDMATSGLMLMARGASAQRNLSQAFASRDVVKRYCAIVSGRMPPLPENVWGVIDLPIILDWPNRPRRMIDAQAGKPSVTRWQVAGLGAGVDVPGAAQPYAAGAVETYDRSTPFTRVTLEPVTGRSHQLRVHLAAIGHPILGDNLYAPPEGQVRASRLLLHACSLGLVHPVSGRPMQFTSPVPF